MHPKIEGTDYGVDLLKSDSLFATQKRDLLKLDSILAKLLPKEWRELAHAYRLI